ncbi:MAG TPA: tRNA (adenosine(37)-N6)-dimethylallyltransferase MiaA [Gammaproteobacteria bacterium]
MTDASGASAALTCLCLTGPTACGKTALALALAERMPLEIVSMDSALVYRGMDIGTAKPSAEVRAAVPHHLIDILDPAEAYSAGRFTRDAAAAIARVQAAGRLPLVVGGTLLYLRALRRGLAPLPEANAAVRAALDAEAARRGWPALHRRLAAVDPAAAARIAPGDAQRIQRALEVYELTGRPLSELQRAAVAPTVRAAVVAVVPGDRTRLARRIEARFDAMVNAGLVEEVEGLRARGDLRPDMPSMRAVGYRQVWEYLDGARDWNETRGRALAATRQLAKRQMTWLQSEGDAVRLDAFAAGVEQRFVRLAGRLWERWA